MLFLCVEDEISEAVGRRIVIDVLNMDAEVRVLGKRGYGYLRANIEKFCEIARRDSVIVMTDLDTRMCAPNLVSEWTEGLDVPNRMLLRVAVREVEAWLMADRDNFADYLGISAARFPNEIESVIDPKQLLLTNARRARRELRNDLLPKRGDIARQGLGYNRALSRFANERWDIEKAKEASRSLERAVTRIAALAPAL